MPSLFEIYTCASAGLVMEPCRSVRAIAGVGLEGDRYALGMGTYPPNKKPKIRQVTIIARGAVLLPFTLSDTRRNLVIEGIEPHVLLALVGWKFQIGAVKFRGTEDCKPCDIPSKIANKPNFSGHVGGFGGIRAEILEGGTLSYGDLFRFEIPEDHAVSASR